MIWTAMAAVNHARCNAFSDGLAARIIHPDEFSAVDPKKVTRVRPLTAPSQRKIHSSGWMILISGTPAGDATRDASSRAEVAKQPLAIE
jgi:hypothetical protein